MMRLGLCCCAVVALALVCVVRCDVLAVEEVNEENFADYVEGNPLMFVEFYAPWCHHCQEFSPVYEEFAKEVQARGVKVVKVDATENQELANSAGVEGYPTLFFFMNREPHEYKGDRTKEALLEFLNKCTLPTSVIKDSTTAQEFLKQKKIAVLGLFPTESTVEKIAFEDIVQGFQCGSGPLTFALFEGTPSQLLGEKAPAAVTEAALPQYVLVLETESGEKEYRIYTQRPVTPTNLYKWSMTEILPDLGEISQETAGQITEAQLPIAFLVAGPDSSYDAIKQQTAQVAKEYRHKLVFVWIDSVKYAGPVSRIAPHTEVYPTFVITDQTSRYVLTQSGPELNSDNIRDFVEKWLKGEVPAYHRSEPVPQENNGPIFNVVGKNFREVVLDDTSRDVLVKFYATRCPHCTEFAPIYEELATHLSEVSTLRVAQLNYPENELDEAAIGVALEGLPAVVMYPANGKNPVLYEGEFTAVDDLLQFVTEQASLPFKMAQPGNSAEKMEL